MQLRPIVVLSDPKVISHNINIKPLLQFVSTEVIEIFICLFFLCLDLIWDPSNLKELGPLKFVGVYNLPPAFWPASLKDGVKNLGSDVDGTNRADDSINIKNPSSFMPYDTTDLFVDFNFLTPSRHAKST